MKRIVFAEALTDDAKECIKAKSVVLRNAS
jgi:hypothetical protein